MSSRHGLCKAKREAAVAMWLLVNRLSVDLSMSSGVRMSNEQEAEQRATLMPPRAQALPIVDKACRAASRCRVYRCAKQTFRGLFARHESRTPPPSVRASKRTLATSKADLSSRQAATALRIARFAIVLVRTEGRCFTNKKNELQRYLAVVRDPKLGV
jgi:hypothetical protein